MTKLRMLVLAAAAVAAMGTVGVAEAGYYIYDCQYYWVQTSPWSGFWNRVCY